MAGTKKYSGLLDRYLSGQIGVLEFESLYLEMFKSDTMTWGQREYEILNTLFGDVDAYCHDPSIRSSHDLDETQLRARIEIAREGLRHVRETRD